MNAPTFDDFWNEIVSDEIWFEQLKMRHPRKDWRQTAHEMHINYLADGNFPDVREVRKHLNNKLIYKKATDEVYRKPFEEILKEDFNKNPLTEEQKRSVDEMLNKAKEELLKMAKPVVQMTNEEIQKYGAERLPKGTPYQLSYEEMEIQAREHKERVRTYRRMTIVERHPDWDEEQIEQRLNELEE